MLKYTDDYLIGIPEIDAEHKHLFELIEGMNQKILSGGDIRVVAMDMKDELERYVQEHFAHEEALMEKIGDAELPRQKKAHAAFVARIESHRVVGVSDEDLKKSTVEMLNYLTRWLIHHILGSDTMIGKNVSPFAFTEKYRTGIAEVDKEHRRLFEIMGQVNELIHNETMHDKFDASVELLEELRDYTIFHFGHEEEIMEAKKYEELPQQKAAHAAFIKKIEEINLEDMDENQQEYLSDILAFLLNWLSTHILGMDKKIPADEP